jgi:hypothetical protein
LRFVLYRAQYFCSIQFDPRIDFVHKAGTRHVANSAAEEANGQTEDSHVGEVEGGLEKAVHPASGGATLYLPIYQSNKYADAVDKLGLEEVIVESVVVHVDGHRGAGGETCPSPAKNEWALVNELFNLANHR